MKAEAGGREASSARDRARARSGAEGFRPALARCRVDTNDACSPQGGALDVDARLIAEAGDDWADAVGECCPQGGAPEAEANSVSGGQKSLDEEKPVLDTL